MNDPRRIASLLAQARGHAAAQKWREASAIWKRLLRFAPNLAEAWDGLGTVAHHAARHAEAERLFRRAVELQPNNLNFRDHLGIALRTLGRLREAVEQYEATLAIAPHRPGTLNNLGNALCEIGDTERAAEILQRAVSLAPDAPGFRVNLARALTHCRRAEAALEQLDRVRASTSAPNLDVDYGHALMVAERYEEAIAAYRRAAEDGVRDYRVFHNLGTALQYFGRADEAAAAYRAAIAIRPEHGPAWRQLAGVRKYHAIDGDLRDLQDLLAAPNLDTAQRAELHMGIAKIFDDLGDYPNAFRHLQTGNQIIRCTLDYSADRNASYIDDVIDTFGRNFFSSRPDFGISSQIPLFVIGMPRSGTTLVEQILASHTEVHGAGELKKIYDLFSGLRKRLRPDLGMPKIARLIDSGVAESLACEYLEYLTAFAPAARYIVDKMPFNFRALGLISLLFPKARIIHCRRDPRDIGLSCYFARFHDELSFTFNLVEIGRYYRDYERLMTHWCSIVRNPMTEVQYETLVRDPEGETRRLLDFCELRWDERCLRFYDTERPVLTASNWQIRQPVYQSSIGRWRNYGEWLGPLLALLGSARDDSSEIEPGEAAATASV